MNTIRKSLDEAFRDAGLTNHPWIGGTNCAAHSEGMDCCVDPAHISYDKMLDYLTDRVERSIQGPPKLVTLLETTLNTLEEVLSSDSDMPLSSALRSEAEQWLDTCRIELGEAKRRLK